VIVISIAVREESETNYLVLGIAFFFTVMTVAEGGGRRAVTHKLRDMYVPTLKANFMVWPTVQLLNFRVLPIQFQVVSYLILSPHLHHDILTNSSYQPFVSSVGIAWTAYLSLTNAAEDAAEARSVTESPRLHL
jgi:protein Mpv17